MYIFLLFRSARTSYKAFNVRPPVGNNFPSSLSPFLLFLLFLSCQSCHLVVIDHPEGPTSWKSSSSVAHLLQIIIRRDWPLANDHPSTLSP